MSETTTSTTPDNSVSSSDFLLGQMSQSIQSLHEELAYLRSDLRRLGKDFATRNELEQVKADIAELERFQTDTVSATASRKWIDRAIIGAITIFGTTAGGLVTTAILKPTLLP